MSQFCEYLTIKGMCIALIDKKPASPCKYNEKEIYRSDEDLMIAHRDQNGKLIHCEDFKASEDITRKLEIHMEIEA